MHYKDRVIRRLNFCLNTSNLVLICTLPRSFTLIRAYTICVFCKYKKWCYVVNKWLRMVYVVLKSYMVHLKTHGRLSCQNVSSRLWIILLYNFDEKSPNAGKKFYKATRYSTKYDIFCSFQWCILSLSVCWGKLVKIKVKWNYDFMFKGIPWFSLIF